MVFTAKNGNVEVENTYIANMRKYLAECNTLSDAERLDLWEDIQADGSIIAQWRGLVGKVSFKSLYDILVAERNK